MNGARARPHKRIQPGDELSIQFESERRSFLVRALSPHHVAKKEARSLLEETTPPPSAAELEARRLERALAPRRESGSGRPSRKERRDLRKFRDRPPGT